MELEQGISGFKVQPPSHTLQSFIWKKGCMLNFPEKSLYSSSVISKTHPSNEYFLPSQQFRQSDILYLAKSASQSSRAIITFKQYHFFFLTTVRLTQHLQWHLSKRTLCIHDSWSRSKGYWFSRISTNFGGDIIVSMGVGPGELKVSLSQAEGRGGIEGKMVEKSPQEDKIGLKTTKMDLCCKLGLFFSSILGHLFWFSPPPRPKF